jgi:hypothetical protein
VVFRVKIGLSGSAVVAGVPCDGVGIIIQDELPVEKRRQSTTRQVFLSADP